jgi:hypothetical protein
MVWYGMVEVKTTNLSFERRGGGGFTYTLCNEQHSCILVHHDIEIPHCNAAPPQAEVRYLTWHRSMSSLSSSSRIPLGTTTKDDTDGLTGNIFSGVYMNAGSHASTLDRLYAWERKLYDEVKVKDLFSAICSVT